MASRAILGLLIVAGLTWVDNPSATADNAAGSIDEMALLPRETLAVARIASLQQLEADRKQLLRKLAERMSDDLSRGAAEDVEVTPEELEGELSNFDVPMVGDLAHPRYFGLLILPQQTSGLAPAHQNGESQVVEFAVVRSNDAEAVEKKLTELDRQQYELDRQRYEKASLEKRNSFFGPGDKVFDRFHSLSATGASEEPEKPKPYHCISHAGWVLYTNDDRCLSVLRRTVADRKHSLAAVIDSAVREALRAGDLSGAVNLRAILDQPESKQIMAALRQQYQRYLQLNDLGASALEGWGLDATRTKQYAQKFIDAAFAMVEEPRWLAGNLDFTADAVRGAGVVTVAKGGSIDEFLRARPPVALDLLEKLPADMPFYLAYRNDHFVQRLMQSFNEPFAATVKEKQKFRARARLLEAGPKQTAIGLNRPLRPDWGLRALHTTEAKDPAAILDYERLTQQREYGRKYITYERAFEELHGHHVDVRIEETTQADSGHATSEEEDATSTLMDAFRTSLAGTYCETWLLARDHEFVSARGYAWDQAKEELEQLEREGTRAVRSKAFVTARQHMDQRANILCLVNFPDVVLGARKVLQRTIAGESQPEITELLAPLTERSKQGPRSYTAGSVRFLPGQIRARFHYPIDQYRVLGFFVSLPAIELPKVEPPKVEPPKIELGSIDPAAAPSLSPRSTPEFSPHGDVRSRPEED